MAPALRNDAAASKTAKRALSDSADRGFAVRGQAVAQLGHDLSEPGGAGGGLRGQSCVVPEVDQAAEDLDPWPVHGRSRALPCASPERHQALVPGEAADGLGKPRLPDAGLAGDRGTAGRGPRAPPPTHHADSAQLASPVNKRRAPAS